MRWKVLSRKRTKRDKKRKQLLILAMQAVQDLKVTTEIRSSWSRDLKVMYLAQIFEGLAKIPIPIPRTKKILIRLEEALTCLGYKLDEPTPMNEMVSQDKAHAFYESYAWRKLRYQVLIEFGRKCMCCGTEEGIMHVDHVKPLRKYWDLRLDRDNLQVLCDECNHGKGNWDETDWRPS